MGKYAFISVLLLYFFLLTGISGYTQDRIAFYGIVSIVDGDLEELSFVVHGDGLVARKVWISKKGKFYFTVPVDKVAFIRSAKPGYLTKRVKIDTHNAFVTKKNSRYNKAVDFDLEMIPQVYNSELSYQGPVGTIAFHELSGLLQITYNYRKRKSQNSKILVVETNR